MILEIMRDKLHVIRSLVASGEVGRYASLVEWMEDTTPAASSVTHE